MEDKVIKFTNGSDLYMLSGKDGTFFVAENNEEWKFYKERIDALKAEGLLTNQQWLSMIVSIRKKLGLPVVQ